MNGMDVLKKIRRKWPNTRIIVISGQQNVMITAALLNNGASDYVSKEHNAIARIEQSVTRLITEKEQKNIQYNRNLLIGFFVLLLGVLIGLLI